MPALSALPAAACPDTWDRRRRFGTNGVIQTMKVIPPRRCGRNGACKMSTSMNAGRSPVQFGAFELDRDAGQLTRSGRRVHLTPQAIRVLTLLTERAGEVVTREEIRESLWGTDTFVEFETAVNACVSQIRTALGDKPTAPRFVETLPRRGYRFVILLAAPKLKARRPPRLIRCSCRQSRMRRRVIPHARSTGCNWRPIVIATRSSSQPSSPRSIRFVQTRAFSAF